MGGSQGEGCWHVGGEILTSTAQRNSAQSCCRAGRMPLGRAQGSPSNTGKAKASERSGSAFPVCRPASTKSLWMATPAPTTAVGGRPWLGGRAGRRAGQGGGRLHNRMQRFGAHPSFGTRTQVKGRHGAAGSSRCTAEPQSHSRAEPLAVLWRAVRAVIGLASGLAGGPVISDPASPEAKKLEAAVTAMLTGNTGCVRKH